MPELSPTAQRVMLAATRHPAFAEDPVYRACIGRAIRELITERLPELDGSIFGLSRREAENQRIRRELLEVADELLAAEAPGRENKPPTLGEIDSMLDILEFPHA